jgi:hypothetical protein
MEGTVVLVQARFMSKIILQYWSTLLIFGWESPRQVSINSFANPQEDYFHPDLSEARNESQAQLVQLLQYMDAIGAT